MHRLLCEVRHLFAGVAPARARGSRSGWLHPPLTSCRGQRGGHAANRHLAPRRRVPANKRVSIYIYISISLYIFTIYIYNIDIGKYRRDILYIGESLCPPARGWATAGRQPSANCDNWFQVASMNTLTTQRTAAESRAWCSSAVLHAAPVELIRGISKRCRQARGNRTALSAAAVYHASRRSSSPHPACAPPPRSNDGKLRGGGYTLACARLQSPSKLGTLGPARHGFLSPRAAV